jgi:hypothetical protein
MELGKSLYTLVLGMSLWCSLASAQITCASESICQPNFVPVFTSYGGNSTVIDSIIQQSGSSVVVVGNLSANEFEIGGSLFAFGSTANENAFLGFAGNSAVTGTGNTAIGSSALVGDTTGVDNTATGEEALENNTTGQYNTAAGVVSLVLNTTGSSNTAVGVDAGYQNTTGNYNTAIGWGAGPLSGNLSNTTAIGAWSATYKSNTLILGGTGEYAVTVGIGLINPFSDYALDIDTTQDSNGVINGGVVVNASGGNLYLGMTEGTHKFRVDTNGVAYADGGFYSSGADCADSVAI